MKSCLYRVTPNIDISRNCTGIHQEQNYCMDSCSIGANLANLHPGGNTKEVPSRFKKQIGLLKCNFNSCDSTEGKK